MKQQKNNWYWIPSLYLTQGLPYVVVMSVAVAMFTRLGMSNTMIAFYTSWLYLPWVFKPLWSPFIDIMKTKRWWIIVMQVLIGGAFAGIALTIPGPSPFRYSLAFMWLLAFSSATHDIAIDGFYMLALDEKKQAYFIGIRNTFYRIATIVGQGLLVMAAGYLEKNYAKSMPPETAIPQAWSNVFYLLAIIFGVLALYHNFILPYPAKDSLNTKASDCPSKQIGKAFLQTFSEFFRKKHLMPALAFILLYRFAESQLAKMTIPFLLAGKQAGGLGLETQDVGFIYGTIGIIALTTGGIIGGLALARNGLRHWIWWMTIAMNIPNIVYLYMAIAQPANTPLISFCVTLEQLGYGFGFTSLTFFMMLFSVGKHQTAHYAICTGFMALGMMLPGMVSGWIEDLIGYQAFFTWIMVCTIPSFIATKYILKIPFIQRNPEA